MGSVPLLPVQLLAAVDVPSPHPHGAGCGSAAQRSQCLQNSILSLHSCVQAAGMVMHPAPGNMTGTLVNALLHYYNLPPVELPGEEQADWVESTTSGECRVQHRCTNPVWWALSYAAMACSGVVCAAPQGLY